jgi:hypothetical protein
MKSLDFHSKKKLYFFYNVNVTIATYYTLYKMECIVLYLFYVWKEKLVLSILITEILDKLI